jgi:transposase
MSTSVHIQQWPPYSINYLLCYDLMCSSQWLFHFWWRDHNHHRPAPRRKRRHLLATTIILHGNARAHTANAVKDRLHRWRWEILEHTPYSPDMKPCDCGLSAKMKEPLRETHYNTRQKIIHAVGQSLMDINKHECTDSVQCLTQIWQKVVHMGANYTERMCVYLNSHFRTREVLPLFFIQPLYFSSWN